MQDLSGALASAARSIAAVIAGGGSRAWIVGGAPRDLALHLAPVEIDLASAATPEVIESLFRGTIPLGRAFGTVIVRAGGVDVQHTTFRSEGTYADARRPDAVTFGRTVEEDSSRRDFTCNAIYLDPLEDAVSDPQGGLADLAGRRLRCVGEASARFREDGLRLLRMARFAAALDLAPDEATLAAARSSSEALRGVSPERVLEELSRIFTRKGSLRAVSILVDLDLLARAIPGLGEKVVAEGGRERWWEARRRVLASLPETPGLALGLAALLDSVDGLRPSHALRRRIAEIRELAQGTSAALAGPRSKRVRWMRGDAFPEAALLAKARALAAGADASGIEAALRERDDLGAAGLAPARFLSSKDLEDCGIPKGPRFGELLREAEDLQLDGRFDSRDAALAWLAARAGAADQEGGNTSRSA
jgi:tRNA nucleotidyltransferase/poly(A) polymerase